METYCTTMDGPVVGAAELALEMENVNYVLPFVKKEDEVELKDAFEKVLAIRELSEYAADVADYWFFETSVRLHCKGAGYCFNGLKAAAYPKEALVKRAEEALKEENLVDLLEFISAALENQLRFRFDDAINKMDYDLNDVDDAREYNNAKLKFVFYALEIYNHVLKNE